MDSQVNNFVEITGTVDEGAVFSHEIYGEKFYSFKIAVKRKSGKNTDCIPCIVSKRICSPHELVCGARMKIQGQFRSCNQCENGMTHLKLNLYVTDMETSGKCEEQNEIYLDGYICKKPVYRRTPLGSRITDIMVAVNRAYCKSDYIPCIFWGKNAHCAADMEVGTRIRIRGRVQSRKYKKRTDKGIEIRIAYEVAASKILGEGEEDKDGQE